MISNDNLILYHGATTEVREPLTHVGRPELDFGPGFYLTTWMVPCLQRWLWGILSKKNSNIKFASATNSSLINT